MYAFIILCGGGGGLLLFESDPLFPAEMERVSSVLRSIILDSFVEICSNCRWGWSVHIRLSNCLSEKYFPRTNSSRDVNRLINRDSIGFQEGISLFSSWVNITKYLNWTSLTSNRPSQLCTLFVEQNNNKEEFGGFDFLFICLIPVLSSFSPHKIDNLVESTHSWWRVVVVSAVISPKFSKLEANNNPSSSPGEFMHCHQFPFHSQ